MPAELAGVRAAKGAGDYRDQHSLGLLLGHVAELCPDRREAEPVQHSGSATDAEDQLSSLDAGKLRLQYSYDFGTNLVEPGVEPIPPLWRVDCGARHDADCGAIATPLRERADHRPGEGRRHFLERGFRAQ